MEKQIMGIVLPISLSIKYSMYFIVIWVYFNNNIDIIVGLASIMSWAYWGLFGIALFSTLLLPSLGHKVNLNQKEKEKMIGIRNKILLNIKVVGFIESNPVSAWLIYIGLLYIFISLMMTLGLTSEANSVLLPIVVLYTSLFIIKVSNI